MEGYIYCFSNPTLAEIYKIGYTTRTPLERLQEANASDTWRLPDKNINLNLRRKLIIVLYLKKLFIISWNNLIRVYIEIANFLKHL
jgi:hypothetical protein